MNTAARLVALSAALLSLSALMLAASGSHLFDMKGLQDSWNTASMIHMFNAAALFGLAAMLENRQSSLLRWAAWFVILGTIIFCGSIYLHVIVQCFLPGVAPAGGLLMISGWALVVLAFIGKS